MSKNCEPVKTDKFPLKKGVSKYNQQLLTETATVSITASYQLGCTGKKLILKTSFPFVRILKWKQLADPIILIVLFKLNFLIYFG